MKENILISTGGSGGHVVPAQTLYEHLKDEFNVFLTSDLRGSKFFENNNKNFKIINVLPLTKNIFLLPWRTAIFFFSILKSFTYLKSKKIKTIISTGGYMSLPICISAKILNLKVILFEPNLVLGRSNLFFLNYCSSILCYSEEIRNFPIKFKRKIKLISPLLRKSVYFEKKDKNNFEKKIKILIIGGSQGADFFQKNLKDTILKLSEKVELEVMHQTNDKNKENLKSFYEKNHIKYELFNFKKNLFKNANEINFCITRAGASSLAELVQINLPFVAIPFPYAKDNHQYYNALFYKKLNCCWMVEQNSNISKDLFNLIYSFFENKNDLYEKINAMKKITYENSWNNINQKIIDSINEN